MAVPRLQYLQQEQLFLAPVELFPLPAAGLLQLLLT